jgi:hypothetical protein
MLRVLHNLSIQVSGPQTHGIAIAGVARYALPRYWPSSPRLHSWNRGAYPSRPPEAGS